MTETEKHTVQVLSFNTGDEKQQGSQRGARINNLSKLGMLGLEESVGKGMWANFMIKKGEEQKPSSHIFIRNQINIALTLREDINAFFKRPV